MTPRDKVNDYMKTIYLLQEKGIVRGAYIAQELQVSRPTVSVTLKKLEQEGYLVLRKDRSVWLTDKGVEIAEAVLDSNRTLRSLLVNLGVDSSIAENDAYNLEHSISKESCVALISFAEAYLSNNSAVGS